MFHCAVCRWLKLFGNNAKELNELINKELIIIKKYLDSNGLSVNTDKTTFMHFRPQSRKKTQLEIKIGNRTISEVECLLFLGVYIDNKLNLREHFNKVLGKIKQGLRGLIMTKHILTYRAKLSIYHALIHSHLSYCGIIWLDAMNSSQMKQLKVIQKKKSKNYLS